MLFAFRALTAMACIMVPASLLGADDKSNGTDKFQGKWSASSVELNGNALPRDRIKAVRLLIHGNYFTVVTGNGNVGIYRFALDRSKTPWTIDLEGVEGREADRKFAGIFRAHEKGITICRDTTGKGDRPSEFTTTGKSGVILEEWEQDKDGFSLADDQRLLQGKWTPVPRDGAAKRANDIRWIQIIKNTFSVSTAGEGTLSLQTVDYQVKEKDKTRALIGTTLGDCTYKIEKGRLQLGITSGGFKGDWEFQRVSWR
jgi:uncharacterized protein (TIGR03067 family)